MKNLLLATRYLPIILNVWVFISMLMLLFGVDITIHTYTSFGFSNILLVYLLIANKAFKLCLWHRVLIYSSFLTLNIETLQTFGLQINNYVYICLMIIILCSIFAISLYIHGCKKTYRKGFIKNHQ